MNYWFDVMQDDCYLIAADSWQATTYRIIEEKRNRDGKVTKTVDKGWTCDLIPKQLIVDRYYAIEKKAIDRLVSELESASTKITELEEENAEDVFSEDADVRADSEEGKIGKITAVKVKERLIVIQNDKNEENEITVLTEWLKLNNEVANLKKKLKDAEDSLDGKAYSKYSTLTQDQIKQLVVDDKWIAAIGRDIHTEMDRISQRLAQRIKELVERYETSLPQQNQQVAELEQVVNAHLEKMGFAWN